MKPQFLDDKVAKIVLDLAAECHATHLSDIEMAYSVYRIAYRKHQTETKDALELHNFACNKVREFYLGR